MSEADKIIGSLKNSGKKVEEFYVSNKTSDKNVGSIEEDINELKTLLFQDRLTNYGKRKMINYYENEITRQKQINEEHQNINGELRERIKELEEANKIFALEGSKVRLSLYIKENYIPKQKIKDKIEELNRKEQELQNSITEEEREEYSDANISFLLCDIEIRREILEELLQESEYK